MASFEDRVAALKSSTGSKNSRSPLDDPFYAESLIIQSKSIVGRMYSSNEYVRFKYECELNQLVKEYRVWLAEIKREEREIGAKLDAMRQEQRDISKERRDLQTIHLVAKTNREFINHYKRRAISKRHDRSVLSIPQTSTFAGHEKKRLFPRKAESADDLGKENKLKKVVRLPKIVSKLDGVARVTKKRRTSLPAISSQNTKTGDKLTKREAYGTSKENITSQSNDSIKHSGIENTLSLVKTSVNVKSDIARNVIKSDNSKKPEQMKVVESKLDEGESRALPLSEVRKPRILSAPKSRSQHHQVSFVTAATRPTSACGTTS
ncbi:Hypothetical predicted protein [Paramuricea clavata]|uniref:Uncharacterized protein n=1 Tax=Paramuricea clavata TaxID=317549 RepID=A0A6S7FK22_PARCT|nr:Hypothetical predicted protein [Paramuricea clavata]